MPGHAAPSRPEITTLAGGLLVVASAFSWASVNSVRVPLPKLLAYRLFDLSKAIPTGSLRSALRFVTSGVGVSLHATYGFSKASRESIAWLSKTAGRKAPCS
jgi:hypothetical protein